MSTETIDTLYMIISFKRRKIAIFAIYNSPKNTYAQFEKHITSAIENTHYVKISSYSVTSIYNMTQVTMCDYVTNFPTTIYNNMWQNIQQ